MRGWSINIGVDNDGIDAVSSRIHGVNVRICPLQDEAVLIHHGLHIMNIGMGHVLKQHAVCWRGWARAETGYILDEGPLDWRSTNNLSNVVDSQSIRWHTSVLFVDVCLTGVHAQVLHGKMISTGGCRQWA